MGRLTYGARLMKTDRREIAPFLNPLFPLMTPDKTSDEWHGFLNSLTGLGITIDEENASAFDKWRMALADLGYPTWDYTQAKIDAIAVAGLALKDAELKRQAALPATLTTAAAAAPSVAAVDLLPK